MVKIQIKILTNDRIHVYKLELNIESNLCLVILNRSGERICTCTGWRNFSIWIKVQHFFIGSTIYIISFSDIVFKFC